MNGVAGWFGGSERAAATAEVTKAGAMQLKAQRPNEPVAHPTRGLSLGAQYLGSGECRFEVWSPRANRVEVHVVSPRDRLVPLVPHGRGYFEAQVGGIEPGTRYFYRLDGENEFPDPASRYQPDGVHRASAVVDPSFPWTDSSWAGIALADYLTCEIHVGTFSREGTFEGIIPFLDDFNDLGVTALELMPVAQFPGSRNWGYDGVHPFAVQNSYGGPAGLRKLVDACHRKGLAVILDVVYNHLGPEGNYLANFGPYFTDRYRTPWGEAVNFDGPDSDEVRRLFVENAVYWIREFHIDALRLDAVHAVYDFSAKPFFQELATAVSIEGERLGRSAYTIAESSLNDSRILQSADSGGWGIDAQWCDDLHHAIHRTLTGEKDGYYQDFEGFSDLVKAYRHGFVYEGQYSRFRRRRHGNSARHLDPRRIVVCSQNHDQVGNRMLGERLTGLLDDPAVPRLAAALVLLSPYQPLLFMGEEYGETSPFQYFVSHGDPDLVAAVREGRKNEFAHFQWEGEIPDPQSEETFERAKLNHHLRDEPRHRDLREFYRELIRIRRTSPAYRFATREQTETRVLLEDAVMSFRIWVDTETLLAVFNILPEMVAIPNPLRGENWQVILDSSTQKDSGGRHLRNGDGPMEEGTGWQLPPRSVTVLRKERVS